MKRIYYMTLLISAGTWSVGAQAADVTPSGEETVLTKKQIEAMEQRITTVTDPAARLFFQANIYRAKGELKQALQTLAQLNVHHAHDKRWISRSELLSAKFYLELGMIDAADVTARQVEALYEGTDVAEKAAALRLKIERLKSETESKRSAK